MNAIILVVDRLHAGYVGAYGNSWIETPAMDRLAAEGFVFDQAVIDSPQLAPLYRSYWDGLHAMCGQGTARGQADRERSSLPAMLSATGIGTTLLTDEPLVADHPLAGDFAELIRIDPVWEVETADGLEETHMAKCVVEIIDALESAEKPFLLWAHLAGLGTTWDAPLAFRETYREEGDPPPPKSADVPNHVLAEDYDPDDVLGATQAYSGQVSAFDTCFGALLECLEASPMGKDTLVVLTSSRGFPLGEHRRLGPCDDALYGELVHVPWIVRFPESVEASPGAVAGARSQALVEPADLWSTLIRLFGVDHVPRSPTGKDLMPLVRQEIDSLRDRACIIGGEVDRAIRTPAWFLQTNASTRLFAKPDDRWEVNDVADRCAAIVDDLRHTQRTYEETIDRGECLDKLPPLEGVLLEGLE